MHIYINMWLQRLKDKMWIAIAILVFAVERTTKTAETVLPYLYPKKAASRLIEFYAYCLCRSINHESAITDAANNIVLMGICPRFLTQEVIILHPAVAVDYITDHDWTDLYDHYSDAILGAMASQITSLTIVYSNVYSGSDQRKHQSSASLAFVRGVHRWLVNAPHKWPVTRKMFPFDDVILVGSDVIYDVEGNTFSTNDSFCIKTHHLPHPTTTDRNIEYIYCDMTTSLFSFMWRRGMIFSKEIFSDGYTKVIFVYFYHPVECYDQPAHFGMHVREDFFIFKVLITELEPWHQFI